MVTFPKRQKKSSKQDRKRAEPMNGYTHAEKYQNFHM